MTSSHAETTAYQHVYVHVPFCARRCSYCDFSIAVRPTPPVEEYVSGVLAELVTRRVSDRCGAVRTLYFGGGTPSRLGADGVVALLRVLQSHITLESDAEITIEANPEDITPERVAAWRAAGVNRLSLGLQSFDDRVLHWMHRTHNAAQAHAALAIARAEGITSCSADLIFALPEILERRWTDDLRDILALHPEHVSLYGLTVEPRTPLGRWQARGTVIEAPEEHYEAEFLAAHALLSAAGYEHYEVSNFGRVGHRSRHNSAYWSGRSYLGLGPAAHGFDGRERRWNIAAYAQWLRGALAGRDPVDGTEQLSPDNRIAEQVYLGLRTRDGLSLSTDEGAHVEPWLTAGWTEWIDSTKQAIRCTPTGWLRLDSLAADLTSLRSR